MKNDSLTTQTQQRTLATATRPGPDQDAFRVWFRSQWFRTYDAIGVPADRRLAQTVDVIAFLNDLADRVAQRMRGFTPALVREIFTIGIERYVTDGGSASFPTLTEPVFWAWIEKYRNDACARINPLASADAQDATSTPVPPPPTDEELIAALRAISGPFEKVALEMGFSTPIYDDLFRRLLDQHGGLAARKRCGRAALERWVGQVSGRFMVKGDRLWGALGVDAVTLSPEAESEIRRYLGARTEGELMMPSFRTLFRHEAFAHLKREKAFEDFDPESGDTPYLIAEPDNVDNV